MRLTVLSPHRDDATFSLALSLQHWSSTGVEISVLNFFTRSGYAPYACEGADISGIRAREDRRSAGIIDSRIQILSLSLLDAPLRLPIDFGSITNPSAFAPLTCEVASFRECIRRISRNSLVLAPLGLGNHIDHRTVHCAAIAAGGRSSLGFYEDLPYAIWTCETAIRERVASAEEELRLFLRPSLLRSAGRRFKERAVRRYQSQIDLEMASAIARYSEKYKGRERIWVPRHSARWRALLRS
jgi:LmbE family N-acetylglucosaminyl deacetylase